MAQYNAAGFKYRRGNMKLGKDTLILNMGPASRCPSREKHLCEITNQGKKCYALKAEQLYKGCLPFRQAQQTQWQTMSARKIADRIGDVIAHSRKPQVRFLRFSEAGDFAAQKDVQKMDQLAGMLKREQGIVTYGYTARRDLNLKHRHMVLSCSGFFKPGCDNKFTGVSKISPGALECPGDCRICDYCKVKHGGSIENKFH
jgi:hypothetical protein